MSKAFCITGWSNSGKTTLIEGLIRCLSARGLRVSVIKHSHHAVAPDRPGSDTERYLRAGAAAAAFSGEGGGIIRYEAPTLAGLLHAVSDADLVLVEGYDQEAELPMIEVWRDASQPMRSPERWRAAIVTERPVDTALPVFRPDEASRLADFLLTLANSESGSGFSTR